MKKNIVAEKSVLFAINVVELYKLLVDTHKEYVMSKQLLSSGTAIGALIREAEHAESKADFIHKMNIALKEANETGYWLLLLKETNFMTVEEYHKIFNQCDELIRLLVSIIKSSKKSIQDAKLNSR